MQYKRKAALSEQDWQAYEALWQRAKVASAFQSPRYLKALWTLEVAQGKALEAYWATDEHDHLCAALFLRQEQGVWEPLSNVGSDHDVITIDAAIGADREAAVIEGLFSCFEHEDVALSKTPEWASYQAIAAARTGIIAIEDSVCPVLACETPAALFETLNTKKLRYYENRLRREESFEVEILEDTQNLKAWVEDFVALHTKRWEEAGARGNTYDADFLARRLLGWAEDGILIRFAIRLHAQPIALCIGLKQAPRLIYHAITYDDAFAKLSPGKALIRIIGRWMQENGFHILDFGNGDEAYKYSFANQNEQLYKLVKPKHYFAKASVRARVEKTIKENDLLYRLWLEKVSPLLRR